MKNFVTYDPNDGRITGRWTVSDGQEVHYPDRVDISADDMATPLEIIKKVGMVGFNPVLIDKAKVDLSASKTTLTANGVDSLTITATGLAGPAKLNINSTLVDISPADNQVIFTTDTAGTYLVSLEMDITQYSLDQITLTAI